MSSLNPHAASYVPSSKREEEKGSDGRTLLDSTTSASEKMPQTSQIKSNPESDSCRSSSQNVTDEDTDIDIEFLRMQFPGLSEQSLRHVYMVKGGDVHAAIDMLTQVGLDEVDLSGSLPETLGAECGDVNSESVSSKLQNVAAEDSPSSKPLAPSKYHK